MDKDLVIESVRLFIDNVLYDMKNVSKSTTKPIILAHIDAWRNELETIKRIGKTTKLKVKKMRARQLK